jgi:hypothetical protein
MFSELKRVPKSHDWSKQNKELEIAIERVRTTYPHRFLQPHELKQRRFAHEPAMAIPNGSFRFGIGPAMPAKRIREAEK